MPGNKFRVFVGDLGLRQLGRWAVLTALVGTVAAGGAILFEILQSFIETHFLEGLAKYHAPGHSSKDILIEIGSLEEPFHGILGWALVLVPTVGGLVSGVLVYLFAPEAEGHGTDAVVRSYHYEGGNIRSHVPVIKLLASAVTIGTGGSAGREGPIAQIGAGFGAWMANLLRLSERERRTLVLAGVAAGIGAMFRAPLGAAFFAAEVLYRRLEFEAESLIPSMIASILSYSLFCMYSGKGFSVIFSIPGTMHFDNPLELALYGVVGVAMALVGMIYVKVFYFTRNRIFAPMPIPPLLKPMVGGFFVGMMALGFPAILGVSYGYLIPSLWADPPTSWDEARNLILFFTTLGFLKIVATSITIGSGGSGGVFAPSLVIGGCFGGVFGFLFSFLFPEIVTQPGTFVLVGMGGFFSGVAKVPFTSLIMVCEMTSGYGLLVPMMLVTCVSYVLTSQRISIYSEQVSSRFDSPVHQGEFLIDILEKIPVRDVMHPCPDSLIVNEETPLVDVLKLSTRLPHQTFPVRNGEGDITGVISLEDVRSYYYESDLGNLVIAGDILRPLESITPENDLSTALQKLIQAEFEEYPVVKDGNRREIVGIISRRDLLATYNQKLHEKEAEASGVSS